MIKVTEILRKDIPGYRNLETVYHSVNQPKHISFCHMLRANEVSRDSGVFNGEASQ